MSINDITNFSTFSFFIYIGLAFIAFWMTPQKYKKLTLLVLSYLFYASYHLVHVNLLLITTIIDFSFGKIIFNRRQQNKTFNIFVYTCVTVNLGILFYFKYSSFVFPSLSNLTYHSILLPLGLSFFTLQSIGYILDIARGKLEPESDFITYALFVSFFPQIIAGPIERAIEIIPQYKKYFSIKSVRWQMVFYLFSWGFFKKYIVADNLAAILQQVQIDEHSSFGLKHLSLIYFFIRIYCDFSGYTNMARAIAMMFTIELKENFNFPLFAVSPQDFWDRWHMSLSRWIKNYFYTPLLIAFESPFLAILIVFPVMGLWHGANINFIFWGLAWALLIIAFKMLHLKKVVPNLFVSIFIMFNISSLLMVFYKVKSFAELKSYLTFQLSDNPANAADLHRLLAIAFLPCLVIFYEFYLFLKNDYYFLLKKPAYYQVIFYLIVIFLYYSFSGVDSQQVFYLQF